MPTDNSEVQTSAIALLADSASAPGDSLADDILRGAEAIGDFIGETDKRVYYLVERGILRVGHLGSALIASKRGLREQYDQLIQ